MKAPTAENYLKLQRNVLVMMPREPKLRYNLPTSFYLRYNRPPLVQVIGAGRLQTRRITVNRCLNGIAPQYLDDGIQRITGSGRRWLGASLSDALLGPRSQNQTRDGEVAGSQSGMEQLEQSASTLSTFPSFQNPSV